MKIKEIRSVKKIYAKKKATLIFFLFLIQISIVTLNSTQAATIDPKAPDRLNGYFFTHLFTTGKNIFASPASWDKNDWLKAGISAIATIAFLPADNSIHTWVKDDRSETTDSAAKVFSAAGAPIVLLGVVSAGYLYGELADRPGARQTFLLAGESLIITEIIVQIGKISIGRARPYTEEGAFIFHPFNSKEKWHSFPSGHAASAWAVASCLASRSDSAYVDVLLYSAAAGISLSRVLLDKHYASDVLAGSLLGYFIGKKVSSPEKQETNKPALALLINRNIIALSFDYSF
jgi:membrane-associated phospholipid phosphatase